MTSLGTFSEGFVLIAAAIACAVLGEKLQIPWLMTIAPVLLTAGLAYLGGGAAGKAQAVRAISRSYGIRRDILKEMI